MPRPGTWGESGPDDGPGMPSYLISLTFEPSLSWQFLGNLIVSSIIRRKIEMDIMVTMPVCVYYPVMQRHHPRSVPRELKLGAGAVKLRLCNAVPRPACEDHRPRCTRALRPLGRPHAGEQKTKHASNLNVSFVHGTIVLP